MAKKLRCVRCGAGLNTKPDQDCKDCLELEDLQQQSWAYELAAYEAYLDETFGPSSLPN